MNITEKNRVALSVMVVKFVYIKEEDQYVKNVKADLFAYMINKNQFA